MESHYATESAKAKRGSDVTQAKCPWCRRLLALYPGSSPCRKTGREPGRFDHVNHDVACLVLCVVLIIELLPSNKILVNDHCCC